MRLIASLLLFVVLLAPAPAHEPSGRARPTAELRELATRIVGGASLLVDVDPRRSTRNLHERAHHFEEVVRRGDGREIRPAWQNVRTAFEDVRRTGDRRDGRRDFVLVHLAEDLEAGDPLIRAASSAPAAPREQRRQYAFVLTEECVGSRAVGKRPCPSPQQELSFRIPPRISTIHRIVGEWRDYGRDVKPQVLLDGRIVWTASAKSGWDTDGKRLTLPVRRGSVLSLRSSNGEPFWVRRLEIEYDETPAR